MKYQFAILPRAVQNSGEPHCITYDLVVCDMDAPVNKYEEIGWNFPTQRDASDFAGTWLDAKNAPVITFFDKDVSRS